jgi:hypothetical protein
MHRIAVVYNDKPLMPMKISRVKRFIKQNKGVLKYNKLGTPYLQLINEPSGYETQEIVVSYDPGSKFDGMTIGSKNNILQNINQSIDTKYIIKKLKKKSMYRRVRRNRLRRRPSRFDSRTSSKLAPSQKAKWQRRINILKLFSKIYPIKTVIIEDVRFNHFKKRWGQYFSSVEVGKNWFRQIVKDLNLKLVEYDGYETKEIRDKFGLKKSSNKAKISWSAHIVDSYVLICKYFGVQIPTSKKFIQLKYRNIARRELIREKRQFQNYEKKVKLYRKNRVKNLGLRNQTGIKKFKSNYGGTVKNGFIKFGIYLTNKGLGILEATNSKINLFKFKEKVKKDNGIIFLGCNRWIVEKIVT